MVTKVVSTTVTGSIKYFIRISQNEQTEINFNKVDSHSELTDFN